MDVSTVIRTQLRTLTVPYFDFHDLEQTGAIVVHELVADDVFAFFTTAHELHFPIQSIIPINAPQFAGDDALSCAANNTSGFNFRTITGKQQLSKHAIGCAFDINPKQNPYIKYDNMIEMFRIPTAGQYDERAPGTLTATHPLVTLLKQKGWTWGGDWTPDSGRVDYQHFEIVPGELADYLK